MSVAGSAWEKKGGASATGPSTLSHLSPALSPSIPHPRGLPILHVQSQARQSGDPGVQSKICTGDAPLPLWRPHPSAQVGSGQHRGLAGTKGAWSGGE